METDHPVLPAAAARRNGELRRLIPPITQKMLTQQLRELEAAGIVARTVHDKVALNVSYAVVPAERCRLEPLIQALCDWGMSWAQNTSATFDALEERSAVK